MDTSGMIPKKRKHRVRLRALARVASISVGIQFGWALQLSLLTPYVQELGIPHAWASYIWLCGPITGMIVQPLVGVWSDTCECKWGRRRPFMVAGTVMASLSVSIIGFSADLGALLGDPVGPTLETGPKWNAVFIFILGFWLLDLSNNTLQGPCRALLADLTGNEGRRTRRANGYFAAFMALGNILGFAAGAYPNLHSVFPFPFILTDSCDPACANLKSAFILHILLLAASTSLSVTSAREISLKEQRRQEQRMADLVASLVPPPLATLLPPQLQEQQALAALAAAEGTPPPPSPPPHSSAGPSISDVSTPLPTSLRIDPAAVAAALSTYGTFSEPSSPSAAAVALAAATTAMSPGKGSEVEAAVVLGVGGSGGGAASGQGGSEQLDQEVLQRRRQEGQQQGPSVTQRTNGGGRSGMSRSGGDGEGDPLLGSRSRSGSWQEVISSWLPTHLVTLFGLGPQGDGEEGEDGDENCDEEEEDDATGEDRKLPLWEVVTSLGTLPSALVMVLIVTGLTWLSLFPFLLFDTDWMGREVLRGRPDGTPDEVTLYYSGVHWGAFGLCLNSVVQGTASLLIDSAVRSVGSRSVWAASNALLSVCLLGTLFVDSLASKSVAAGGGGGGLRRHLLFLLSNRRLLGSSPNRLNRISVGSVMRDEIKSTPLPVLSALAIFAALGIPMAVTYSIPYSLASIFTSSEGGGQGAAMGVLNLAVVLPQMLVSVASGPLDEHFGGGNIPAFMASCLFAALASAAAFFLVPKPPVDNDSSRRLTRTLSSPFP